METKTIFSKASAKASVIELAAKTKHLKSLDKDLLRRYSAGEAKPTVPWVSGDETKQLVRWEVQDKLKTRSKCSRIHQLAYAFIRGVPYRAVESKTPRAGKPPVFDIIEVLEEHLSEEGRQMVVGPWAESALRKEVWYQLLNWAVAEPAHLKVVRLHREHQVAVLKGDENGADQLWVALEVVDAQIEEKWRPWVQRRVARITEEFEARKARKAARKEARKVA